MGALVVICKHCAEVVTAHCVDDVRAAVPCGYVHGASLRTLVKLRVTCSAFMCLSWVQIMMRQFPANVAEAVAWRTREKREEDASWRSTGSPSRRFSYAAPNVLSTCEGFLAEDTSINVLEHIERLGGIPGPNDKEDSDKVLKMRMNHGAPGEHASNATQ